MEEDWESNMAIQRTRKDVNALESFTGGLLDQFKTRNETMDKLGLEMAKSQYQSPKDQAMTNYYNKKSESINPVLGGFANQTGDQPTGDEFLKRLSPQEQNLVKGMADYKLDPAKTFGLRNDLRAKYISYAQQYEPSFDMSQYTNRQKVNQDFTSGKTAVKVTGLNTAIKHAANLYNSIDSTPDSGIFSGIKPINALTRSTVSNLFSGSPGSKGMTAEDSSLTAIAGELANIMKQTGATDQEIDKWIQAYDRNASKENKKQYVKTGMELLTGRLKAFEEQYERGVGKKYPGQLISPTSQQLLGKIMGGQVQRADMARDASVSANPLTKAANPGKESIEQEYDRAVEALIASGMDEEEAMAQVDREHGL